MLLASEARMPDGMGLIWYCAKHLTGQKMLRLGGTCMKEFCDRKLRLKSNLI